MRHGRSGFGQSVEAECLVEIRVRVLAIPGASLATFPHQPSPQTPFGVLPEHAVIRDDSTLIEVARGVPRIQWTLLRRRRLTASNASGSTGTNTSANIGGRILVSWNFPSDSNRDINGALAGKAGALI